MLTQRHSLPIFVFFLLLTHSVFCQTKVLYVSNDFIGDRMLRDSLLTIGDIEITEITPSEFNADTTPEMFEDYDAVFITEGILSSSIPGYATAGFPLPTVCFEPRALGRSWGLITQTEENSYTTSEGHTGPEAMLMLIEKPDHPLFYGLQNIITDTIRWTNGVSCEGPEQGYANVFAFDLKQSNEPSINENATCLARNYLMTLESDISQWLWAIEENSVTKRMVTWGIHSTYQEMANNVFYTIAKNSLIWVLKIKSVLSDIKVDDQSIPNFNSKQLHYNYQLDEFRDPLHPPVITAFSNNPDDIISIMQPQDLHDTAYITLNSAWGKVIYSITFNPVPMPYIDTICSNDSILLCGIPIGGLGSHYTYQWESVPTGFASLDSCTCAHPNKTTSYKVTATNKLSASILTKNFIIEVLPAPKTPNIELKGDDILICTDSGMYFYNWYYEGSIFQNEHKQFLSFNNNLPGNYYVEVVNDYLCKTKSDPYPINKKSGSLNIPDPSVYVYPNPNDEIFTVTIESEYEGVVYLYITDYPGKLIKQYDFIKENYYLTREINLKGMPKGLYTLYVKCNDKIVPGKVVIK